MPEILTRRGLLLAGAAIAGNFALRAAGGEFWEKKPPAEWTSEEIDRLISKSPWAKEVSADYAPRESGGGPGPWGEGAPTGGQQRGGRMGGINIPGIGGRRNGGQGRGSASSYKGTVRWESAKPILEAMKAPLPDQFANHYVISVNGFPLLGGHKEGDEDSPSRSQDSAYDNLKQFTSLHTKSKEPLQAGVVHRQISSGNSFLFGFSQELLPLSASDGEAVFTTRLGALTVTAKFVLKEMLYHQDLAV